MKRFGFGLLAAGLLAAATLLTTVPASARGGGGMIWFPPMDGMGGGGMGGWHGSPGGLPRGCMNGAYWGGCGRAWHGPGTRPIAGNNGHRRQAYHGQWNGNGWNNGWNRNWYRNGHWYGPRYRYRYPGYNYYYSGFWYPWPWWNNAWSFEIGENYGYPGGYYGGGRNARHIAWCQGRYRSYNPRTDTYTGYDGRQHRCKAPY